MNGKNFMGWLFADKGYLGKSLTGELKAQAIKIFTKVRKNMSKRITNKAQELLVNKRGIIETVIDQLKNCRHY
ncbi:transposase, IS982 family protein [endosymbiont of Acanthamoeba sp. UWC8]|nr:transposase, IS982 family protein [endosymbiont of Acanthamoeba sp. UWC8]